MEDGESKKKGRARIASREERKEKMELIWSIYFETAVKKFDDEEEETKGKGQ